MRKIIFRSLYIIFMMLMVKLTVAQKKNDIRHGPFLQNLSESEVTILFSSDSLVVPGVILFEENKQTKIQNSEDGLINVGVGVHKVKLSDLKLGKSYKYKVFAVKVLDYQPYKCVYGDTIFSDIHEFTTFDTNKKEVNFTMFCDVHDDASKIGRYIAQNDIQNQDFYLLNGDILGHIDTEEQIYSNFLDTCINRFAQSKPFFYVRGNHETRGACSRLLKHHLALKEDKYYYAFSQGSIRFVVLDGGEDKPDDNKEYSGLVNFDEYRKHQLNWLKNEVSSEDFKSAKVKIVFVHMPIVKDKRNLYGMTQLAKHYGPVLRKAGIDLMLSGHMHQNTWIEANKSGFNYPVMICSNSDFLEASIKDEQIHLRIKNQEGKTIKNVIIK